MMMELGRLGLECGGISRRLLKRGRTVSNSRDHGEARQGSLRLQCGRKEGGFMCEFRRSSERSQAARVGESVVVWQGIRTAQARCRVGIADQSRNQPMPKQLQCSWMWNHPLMKCQHWAEGCGKRKRRQGDPRFESIGEGGGSGS